MKLFTTALIALSLYAAPAAFADHHEDKSKCTCTEKCAHHEKHAKTAGESCSGECKGCAEGKCSDTACAGGHHDHQHQAPAKAEKKG